MQDDTTMPNPASNKSKAEGERTLDESADTRGGMAVPKEGPGVERARDRRTRDVRQNREDDLIARTGEERRATPRKYDQRTDDATMPSDDATLNTKI